MASLTVNNELHGSLSGGDTLLGVVETAIDPTYALSRNAGYRIELFLNSGNYQIYAKLRDIDDNIITTSNTIDLPIESMVVNGRYDNQTQSVILTLQNGNTVSFSVADLVAGLQTELSSTNKLNSDYVDDTNQTNKFVTTSEKTTWNNKVSPTDYASSSTGGVVKVSSYYGNGISGGMLYATNKTYAEYQSATDGIFISKNTLENVITGKDLTTKAYVDGLIGDINSALDAINGEVV